MTDFRPPDSARPTRRLSGCMTRAGIGAGVTLVLSVVPVGGLVAPAIGGGVASWIARDTRSTGSRIGATAGGLVTLLLLPLVLL